MKTIGQVSYQKPLHRLGMEELAARQRALKNQSGGVLFSRNIDGPEKSAARDQVLALFTPQAWPGPLHMLTLPGLQWRFERKLLGAREVGWMMHKRSPQRTYITGCENDRAIFYAAVPQMPGLHTPDSILRRIKTFGFAEQAVKTRYASLFFGSVDDMMAQQNWNEGWDAAWLDYTGPLTPERLVLIRRFYHRWVRRILVVTALKARFNEATMRAIERAGGHSPWWRAGLVGEGDEVLHELDYFDSSPMVQFAIRKIGWRSPLV